MRILSQTSRAKTGNLGSCWQLCENIAQLMACHRNLHTIADMSRNLDQNEQNFRTKRLIIILLCMLFLKEICQNVFSQEQKVVGIDITKTSPELEKMLEKFIEEADIRKLPLEAQRQHCDFFIRAYKMKQCIEMFFQSTAEIRKQYGIQSVVDVFNQQGTFNIYEIQQFGPSLNPDIRQDSTGGVAMKAAFECKVYSGAVIVGAHTTNKTTRFQFKVEQIEHRIFVTYIYEDKTFDSVKWLVEKQDLAVHEFLRELIAKPHETRDLASIELERLLPAEKLFFYKASNVKGELATAEHEVIYAVTVSLDVPVDAKPAAVFLFIGIKKVDEKWVISSVAEDARKKADFQKNIVIADFIWCYIKATPKERSKMRTDDVKSKLPETGVLTLDSNRKQIDPFAVCSLEDAKWTIRVALTHSERFGHIQKNRIWFKFFVSENAKGALKVYEEQMHY